MGVNVDRKSLRRWALVVGIALFPLGCHTGPAKSPDTVSLRVKGNVADAQVTIDDIAVGALAYVAARGVALPPGRHRVTVEKAGYFPFDTIVEARDKAQPIFLQIALVPVPD
jgi:hypothetical protein